MLLELQTCLASARSCGSARSIRISLAAQGAENEAHLCLEDHARLVHFSIKTNVTIIRWSLQRPQAASYAPQSTSRRHTRRILLSAESIVSGRHHNDCDSIYAFLEQVPVSCRYLAQLCSNSSLVMCTCFNDHNSLCKEKIPTIELQIQQITMILVTKICMALLYVPLCYFSGCQCAPCFVRRTGTLLGP